MHFYVHASEGCTLHSTRLIKEIYERSEISTLLHSFVIFPVSETIFGMSGCFPVSQGQEMKDLTASSGRKATNFCWKLSTKTRFFYMRWTN